MIPCALLIAYFYCTIKIFVLSSMLALASNVVTIDTIFIGIWIGMAVTLMVTSLMVDGTDPWANWDYDPG
jgi:hypothetical protein